MPQTSAVWSRAGAAWRKAACTAAAGPPGQPGPPAAARPRRKKVRKWKVPSTAMPRATEAVITLPMSSVARRPAEAGRTSTTIGKTLGTIASSPGTTPPSTTIVTSEITQAGREEAREQVAEQRVLDRVDQRHRAGVFGRHAAAGPAVVHDHRLDHPSDLSEKDGVVETAEGRGAGGHPPELAPVDVPNQPHRRELGEPGLEPPGDHHLAGHRQRDRGVGQIGHERARPR